MLLATRLIGLIREKSVRLLPVFLALSLFPQVLKSQTAYQFTRYSQEDGLATGSITQIAKDKSGFFWLLSENGLMRFDGYEFKIFVNNASDSLSLPASNFYEMNVDDKGTILFRTMSSICKYMPQTGTFKKIISVSDSIAIYDWAFGAGSTFWATSKNHLLRIDAESESVTRFRLPDDFNRNFMMIGESDSNEVWIYNEKSQWINLKLRENKIRSISVKHLDSSTLLAKNTPRTTFKTEDGIVRMLTWAGMYKYDEISNAFVQYSRFDKKPERAEYFQCDALPSGRFLYIGNNYGELIRIDSKDGSTKHIQLENKVMINGSRDFAFHSIYSGFDGTIWISTTTAGVFHFFPETDTWEQLIHEPNNQNSLTANSTDFILPDENNLVWINCAGRGIVKAELIRPILASYLPTVSKNTSSGINSENVRTISALDENYLLIGSLGGLTRFNISTHDFEALLSPVDGKPILTNNPICHILKDKNENIWISEWMSPAMYVLNYKTRTMQKFYPDSSLTKTATFRCMFIDSHGNFWAGTDEDVLYRCDFKPGMDVDPKNLIFKKYSNRTSGGSIPEFKLCFVITENENGNILFGMQNGFYEYSYATNRFSHFMSQSKAMHSLRHENIRSLHVDREGKIWAGTYYNGLVSIDESSEFLRTFSVRDGLPDNTIYTILEDNKGYLWLGTNKGLCRFNPKNQSCRNYSMKDGIQNYEYNTNAAFKTKGGDLAFGGRTGFNFFHPDSIAVISSPPPIVITKLSVFGNERPIADQEIKLKHNENSISLQFAALSFFRNKENQYAYMLEGVDKDWIYCGDRRFTNYANLSPGNYVFRVKAANCFGIWNEEGIVLNLVVGTPWWKTFLFRVFVLLALTAFIYALFRYRLRQKMKLQEVRNKIARDLHDEIGSNLSSISLFSEVANEKTPASNPVSPLLKKISEYTQMSQEGMNDIVWMINSRNDNFEKIIVHMRTLAAELFEAKNVTMHLNFDEKLNHFKMDMDKRKNFYLIYKESVNNIVKYAECKNVWIDLESHRSRVVLRIKDDGKGFNPHNQFHGNGLVNMKKRSETLNGKLTIESGPEIGTLLELTFGL